MTDFIDPYKILQVDSEAEDEVIRAAYRRLARKYHPDLATAPEAASRMAAMNAAWELIGDPIARKAFDRARAIRLQAPVEPERGSPPASAAGSTPSAGAGSGGPASSGDANGPPGATSSAGTPSSGGATSSGGPTSAGGGASRPTGPASRPPTGPRESPAETVSRDWTSGRSTEGSVYDESMRAADGFGAAGPPPGRPTGTLLNFGRYAGWSLGEVARTDIEYIEWLDRAPIGRNYRQEVDALLRKSGRRKSVEADAMDRRGLYRRR
jgi:curved DNA-binding protein CbpA